MLSTARTLIMHVLWGQRQARQHTGDPRAETFDVIVIGTGSGGSAPAYRCREAGWRVAVLDDLPYGGTCALRGCDPKKVLVGAAELADLNRRMDRRGITCHAQIL